MTRRHPSPPETQALTILAITLAGTALAWTPGTLTPALAATATYLATVTGGAWALRWNIPTTLATTTVALRRTLAAALIALAHLIQAAATATLWLISQATTALTTSTADYTVAA